MFYPRFFSPIINCVNSQWILEFMNGYCLFDIYCYCKFCIKTCFKLFHLAGSPTGSLD